MTVEFRHLLPQIETATSHLAAARQDWLARLERALELANTCLPAELAARAASGTTLWTMAGLREGLAAPVPPPDPPHQFSVAAVDGSHLEVDRHMPLSCYIINLGSALLSYGPRPSAHLSSTPHLFAGGEGLAEPGGSHPMEPALLAMKRSVEESRYLASLLEEAACGEPTLALIDGSLILWGPQAEFHPASIRETFLNEGLLPAWDRIQALSRATELALASYISHPGSMEVVNLLRLALCPHEVALCERCTSAPARECDALAGLRDRDLFWELLEPGQRSPVFASGSSVVRQRYRQHQVCFFYLHTGEEIGRVEVHQWVADQPGYLELAHALAWDQVQRGRGYPVALAEAHEQAVVTAADREFFWALVDQALGKVRLSTATSAKSRSKRLKWA